MWLFLHLNLVTLFIHSWECAEIKQKQFQAEMATSESLVTLAKCQKSETVITFLLAHGSHNAECHVCA